MQNLLRVRKVSLIKVTTEKVTTSVMTVMTDRINRTKMYLMMVDDGGCIHHLNDNNSVGQAERK
jgi:hypothetical protein